ncbi:hypothetical protein HMPREF1861_02127 [Corynebacterium kroppenstedtii]|nr:hypothetical protein HMPREF1861_02127 [Corynebacterium kroppenstedtii]
MACYYKPGFNLEEQVQELSDRGLVINDISRAEEQVRRIGYYRLSSYSHPFRQKDARRMSSLVSGAKQPG